MNYIAVIEGQQIQLPEEIAVKDESVKAALAPYFPEAATAMISREVKDDTTTLKIIKKAGTKGLDPLGYLHDCRGGRNPVIELWAEIEDYQDAGYIESPRLLELASRVDEATMEGKEQAKAVDRAAQRLAVSTARPAPAVPEGF